jgi:hypothetical protein
MTAPRSLPRPLGVVQDQITAAVAEARDEISRTDTKAGTLLTVATGALAGLVTFAQAGHLPVAAAVLLWLAASLSAAALVVLLTVVRPRLGASSNMFADHEALLNAAACDLPGWQEARLRLLSGLAVTKHRRLRRAVDTLLAGLAVLAAAVVLAVFAQHGGAR